MIWLWKGNDRFKMFVFSLFIFMIVASSFPAFVDTAFKEGENLFVQNKPADALVQLRTAVKQEPGNQKSYLYLGIAYEQLGQYEQAVDVFKKGLLVSGDWTALLHFDLGNNLFRLGRFEDALEAYTNALLEDPSLKGVFLNRANTWAAEKKYESAVEDYEAFLTLSPNDPQREKIEALITLLKNTVAEEKHRMAEEETRRIEEERRQKALLDEVLNSLSNITQDTTNLRAGQEEIDSYEDEIDIVD